MEINTTDEILLSIMNQKTVSGLPFFVDSDSDGNLPVAQHESEDIIFELNEHDSIEDGSVILTQENNYELATTSTSDYPTWKKYTPANLQDPVHPSLKSATVNIPNDESFNNITPKAGLSKNASRRRPTTSIRTFTSSDIAKKYDVLLDRRLVLVDKQMKQIDEEREFKKENHNLTMELRALEIKIKQRQLTNTPL